MDQRNGGQKTFKLRRNLWDEENRLKAVDLKPDEKSMHLIAIYTYNASGERTVRYNLDRLDAWSNENKVGSASKDNITIYPNGLFMAKVNKKGSKSDDQILTYTKYYYIGSERVAAKVGHITNLGHYPKTPAMTGNGYASESLVKNASDTRVTAAQGAISKVYTAFDMPQPSFSPATPYDVTSYIAGKNYEAYYMLNDHLGSSSHVTNSASAVCQHMEYLPFGEIAAQRRFTERQKTIKAREVNDGGRALKFHKFAIQVQREGIRRRDGELLLRGAVL